MYIIVGLGNPGRQYENTRHNMGFHAVDQLAEKHNIRIGKIKFKALVGEGNFSGQKVVLVKPQTYMNLSGQSVREIVAYYKVPPENLMVIYDDVDIPLGTIRIRAAGSAGTHNGMRSVVYDLQDDRFPRIRIGIGGDQHEELINFVMGGFSGDGKKLAESAILKAAEAAECFVEHGIQKAMNTYNIRTKKKQEKAPREPEQEPAEGAAEEAAVTMTAEGEDRPNEQ